MRRPRARPVMPSASAKRSVPRRRGAGAPHAHAFFLATARACSNADRPASPLTNKTYPHTIDHTTGRRRLAQRARQGRHARRVHLDDQLPRSVEGGGGGRRQARALPSPPPRALFLFLPSRRVLSLSLSPKQTHTNEHRPLPKHRPRPHLQRLPARKLRRAPRPACMDAPERGIQQRVGRRAAAAISWHAHPLPRRLRALGRHGGEQASGAQPEACGQRDRGLPGGGVRRPEQALGEFCSSAFGAKSLCFLSLFLSFFSPSNPFRSPHHARPLPP